MANIFEKAKGKEIESRYGIKSQRLIRESGVRNVFTPRTPIIDANLFSGREKEVEMLLEYITSPGLHSLLYGDRGVGKSSLANITTYILLKDIHPKNYRKSCSSIDTFETIFETPLMDVGIRIGVHGERDESGGVLKGGIGFGHFQVGSEKVKGTERTIVTEKKVFNPSEVADALKTTDALMVIDELDRLEPSEVEKIAELIKILSDYRSPFKLLLVGIAHNSKELISGHLSVQRCLMQIYLSPMSDSELRDILEEGEKETTPPIKFTEVAKNQIVQLSSGYPHFTHLLGLKAAEEAISNEEKSVTVSHVVVAVNKAREAAEEGLRDLYDAALLKDSTGLTKRILISLAKSMGKENSFKDIGRMIKSIFGELPEEGKLRYRLKCISSPTPDTILRKTKGGYFINDPRMMCYVRIMNPDFFREYFK